MITFMFNGTLSYHLSKLSVLEFFFIKSVMLRTMNLKHVINK